jgi:hypothetical protein
MYAGSLGINPGDYLNPDGSVSIGLLGNVGAGSGTGLVSNPDGITGTNFTQTSYDASGAILYGAQANVPQTLGPTCTVNCQGGQTVAHPVAGASTIFVPPSAPEFDLLGDGTWNNRGASNTAWISTGTGGATSTLTIPVGIFGVNDVATLLNTTGGVMTGGTVCAGATITATANTTCTNTRSYSYVTLEFNHTDPTGLTGTDLFETVSLVNGVTQRNILDGTCVNGSASFCTGTGALATTQSNGLVMDPNTGIMYTIVAQNDFTGSTSNNIHGTNGPANNSTMFLDAQLIPVFSEYSGNYLVSVSITNTGTSSGANYNEEVLSGLTVTASPEPSTILMLLGGIGVMAASRLRRKKA